MKPEGLQRVDLSRRKFLRFGGWLGLTLGAFSLTSLGWTEPTPDANREDAQELWLEAKKKSKKTSGKKKSGKKSTSENGNTDWQEMA